MPVNNVGELIPIAAAIAIPAAGVLGTYIVRPFLGTFSPAAVLITGTLTGLVALGYLLRWDNFKTDGIAPKLFWAALAAGTYCGSVFGLSRLGFRITLIQPAAAFAAGLPALAAITAAVFGLMALFGKN